MGAERGGSAYGVRKNGFSSLKKRTGSQEKSHWCIFEKKKNA